MTITIVTLYRANSCEHFVGAVKGTVSPKQRKSLAKGYSLEGADLTGDH